MTKPKILAFAGSLRQGSFNKKLIKIAVKGAEQADADITLIDLADFTLPAYNGDDEAAHGLPENAKKLKQLMIAHDGLLISSPEYNSSISGAFKNVIDWVSRPEEGEKISLPAFRGKVAAIMSASPSGLGGLRGLVHLRAILENIHVMVLPEQVTVPSAHEAFDEDGHLKDQQKEKRVISLGSQLAKITAKLTPSDSTTL